MTLAFKSSTVSVAFGTASFFMDNGGRTVRVDVSEELLARIGGHRCMSKQERVRRLERHKRRFAQIAAAKYDEGHYETEVKVLVVRLGVDDVINHAHGEKARPQRRRDLYLSERRVRRMARRLDQ